ncbi:MAG TPA: (2Fe-2S)-binding protein [Oleiagrimonas sp.]|nr:(2Fe-2S)-binding protein [Oleiagrimonas sp.]
MSTCVRIIVNGRAFEVPEGISVAAAIAHAGQPFRRALGGQRRFPLCGMGVCFECRARIDGAAHQQTCMVPVRAGMKVDTDD